MLIRASIIPGFLLVIILQFIPFCLAQENVSQTPENELSDTGRLYTTNSERREAGLTHEITPWLTASFLVELEAEVESYRIDHSNHKVHQRMSNATAQVGLLAQPWESIKAELILEYDTETSQLIADEAFVSLEMDDWEIEAGRMYIPFGAYISHFATGPILEFGETRADTIILSYGPSDTLDFSVSAYQGKAHQFDGNSHSWDWAIAFEAWLTEQISAGMSFQSDLADSDERLLEDTDNRYARKVPALSGYAIWSSTDYEISFEALGALRSFDELEHDRNQPLAWNLEFVHFLSEHLEWALRFEGSHEFEDAPEFVSGISLTWRILKNSTLTVEYLHGKFKETLAVSDDDENYDRIETIAAQLSVIF